MNDNENVRWVYDALSKKGLNLGTYEQFTSAMKEDSNKKWLYDMAKDKGLNLGTYEQLDSAFSVTPTMETKVPVKMETTSSGETAPREKDSIPQPDTTQMPKTGLEAAVDSMPTPVQVQQEALAGDTSKYDSLQENWRQQEEDSRNATKDWYENKGGKEQLEAQSKRADAYVEDKKTWGEKALDKVSGIFPGTKFDLAVKAVDAITDVARRWLDPEYGAARTTQEKIEETQKMLEEASHSGNSWADRQLKGLARGFREAVIDARTWDFGANDLTDSWNVNSALDKVAKKEPLSVAEENLLDAIALTSELSNAYQDDVSMGYRVGQSVPESASFAAAIAMNPASGFGKSFAQAALKKYARTKFGGLGLRTLVNGARFAGDAGEALVTTFSTGLPRTLATIGERMEGQSKGQMTDGNYSFIGNEKTDDSRWESVWKGALGSYFENESEMMGEYLAPAKQFVKRLFANSAKSPGWARGAVQYLTSSSDDQVTNVLNKMKGKAHINGLAGEYLEEVMNNVADAAIIGDMNFNTDPNSEEWKQSVFNLETNIETFLSVAAMLGPMKGVELAGRGYNKYSANQMLKARGKYLDEVYDPASGNGKYIRKQIDSARDWKEMAEKFTQLRDSHMISNEREAKAVLGYMSALVEAQTVNTRYQSKKYHSDRIGDESQVAYEAGQNMKSEDYHKANLSYAPSQQQAYAMFGERMAEAMVQMTPWEFNNLRMSMNPEQRKVAAEYYNQASRMKGILDKEKAEVDAHMDYFKNKMAPAVRTDVAGSQYIQTVTYTDPRTDTSVRVPLRSIEGGSATIEMEGIPVIVSSNTLSEFETQDYGQMLEEERKNFAKQKEAQRNWNLAHNPKTQMPYAQTIINMPSPEQGGAPTRLYVTDMNTENGTVNVVPTQFDPTINSEVPTNQPVQIMSLQDALNGQDAYYDALDFGNMPKEQQAEAVAQQAEAEQAQQAQTLQDIENQLNATPAGSQSLQQVKDWMEAGEDVETIRQNIQTQIEEDYRDLATQYLETATTATEPQSTEGVVGEPQPAEEGASGTQPAVEGTNLRNKEGQLDRALMEQSGDAQAAASALRGDFPDEASSIAQEYRDLSQTEVDNETEPITKRLKARAVRFWQEVLNILNPIAQGGPTAAEIREQAQIEATEEAKRNFPKIVERWQNAPKKIGRKSVYRLPDGTRITGHYVLTESGAFTPSHDPHTFKPTEGFPTTEQGTTVNSRDYEHDDAAQQQVALMGQSYNGNALQDPIVVSQDGIVYSGNNRTMSGQLAAENGTDADYLEDLGIRADEYGFTEEDIAEMEHPRVVFVTDADQGLDYTPKTFDRFNAQRGKGQSATEKAIKFGKILDDKTFGRLVDVVVNRKKLQDVYKSPEDCKEIADILEGAGVMSPTQRVEFLDSKGQLTPQGQEALEGALIGYVFKGDEQVVRLLNQMPAVRKRVIAAINEIVKNRRLGEFSLASELGDAITLLYEADQSGMDLSSFYQQTDFTRDIQGLYDATKYCLATMLDGTAKNTLKEALQSYNTDADTQLNGGSLFGQMNRQELLEDILRALGYELKIRQNGEQGTGQEEGTGTETDTTPEGDDEKKQKIETLRKSIHKELIDIVFWDAPIQPFSRYKKFADGEGLGQISDAELLKIIDSVIADFEQEILNDYTAWTDEKKREAIEKLHNSRPNAKKGGKGSGSGENSVPLPKEGETYTNTRNGETAYIKSDENGNLTVQFTTPDGATQTDTVKAEEFREDIANGEWVLAEQAVTPPEDTGGEEEDSTPLTAEQIKNSGADQIYIDSALDYLEESVHDNDMTKAAYEYINQLVKENARTGQDTGTQGSEDANASHMGSEDNGAADGAIGQDGDTSGEVVRGTGEGAGSDTGRSETGIVDAEPGSAPLTGAGGATDVSGGTAGTDVSATGGTQPAGGNRSGDGGRTVRQPKGEGESGSTAESDGVGSTDTSADLNAEIDDLVSQIGDILSGKTDDKNILGMAVVPFQNQMARLIKAMPVIMKVGHSLLKKGYYTAERWTEQMHKTLDKVLEQAGFKAAEIAKTIKDCWNSSFTDNGRRMKMSEWAEEFKRNFLLNEQNQSFEAKKKAQEDAEGIEVKVCDRENIDQTLPFLFESQREDVYRAEKQFFDPTHQDAEHCYGKGYLFTNQTGTGKTYVGLGIIKRFVKQGKGRVLIIVPSEKKEIDWATRDAANMGLKVTPLRNSEKESEVSATRRKGEGIVVTTFENFRDNEALLEDEFDLIVCDECHKLMQNQKGKDTEASERFHMITNRDSQTAFERLKYVHPLWVEERNLQDEIGSLAEEERKLDEDQDYELPEGEDYNSALRRIYTRRNDIQARLNQIRYEKQSVEPNLRQQANESVKKTKVVMLSATPFSAREALRWAGGYIFDVPGGNFDDFLLRWFPDAYTRDRGKARQRLVTDAQQVNNQEVAFADHLEELGTMSGRISEVPYDYSRDFPIMDMPMAAAFNAAYQAIAGAGGKYSALLPGFTMLTNYESSTVLFETLKASAVIPRIKEHLALGRKVVIFHSRRNDSRKDPVSPPFRAGLDSMTRLAMTDPDRSYGSQILNLISQFEQEYKDLLEWEAQQDYRLPREQLAAAFGEDNVGFFSGAAEDKRKGGQKEQRRFVDVRKFNSDDSGMDMIVCQTQSAREGIDLHDTTAKHQRVEMVLSLPTSSIEFIQIEGRIYRSGSKSNAIFEYPLLGINLELQIFANKINARAATTENLALGSKARNLRQAIADGILLGRGIIPVASQGRGGKEFDNPKSVLSGIKKAIADFKNRIKGDTSKQEKDCSPEPLGYTLVQWAGIRAGDNVMEPSAGRGNVARYFPNNVKGLFIEPDAGLRADLMLATGAIDKEDENAARFNFNVSGTTFENVSTNRKFDEVVMVPPVNDDTVLSVETAFANFLENSGRLVAVVPTSSVQTLKEELKPRGAVLVAEVKLPSIAYEDPSMKDMTVIVADKVQRDEIKKQYPEPTKLDFSGCKTMEEFFAELEKEPQIPPRILDPLTKRIKRGNALVNTLKGTPIVETSGRGRDKYEYVSFDSSTGNFTFLPRYSGSDYNARIYNFFSDKARATYGYISGSNKGSLNYRVIENIGKEPDNLAARIYVAAKDALDAYNPDDLTAFKQEVFDGRDVADDICAIMYKYQKALCKYIEEVCGLTEDQIRRAATGENIFASSIITPGRKYSTREFRSIFEDNSGGDVEMAEHFDIVFPLIKRENTGLVAGRSKAGSAATYSPRTNTITIGVQAWNRMGADKLDNATTLLHEMSHMPVAYARTAKERGLAMSQELKGLCESLDNLFNTIMRSSDSYYLKGEYGLTNADELISESSDPKVREKMKRVNLWKKEVNGVTKYRPFETYVTPEEAAEEGYTRTNSYAEAMNLLKGFVANHDLDLAKQVGPYYEGSGNWGDHDAALNEATPPFKASRFKSGETRRRSDVSDKELEDTVVDTALALRVPVYILHNEDELDKSDLTPGEKRKMKRNGKGMYDTKTRKVYVYLPHLSDTNDARKVVLHEIVGHKGLRKLFGEQEFDRMMVKIFGLLPKDVRDAIVRRAKSEMDIPEAVDEYLAEVAEQDETPNWWTKVVSQVKEFLRAIGLDMNLSENEVKYLLWQSKNQLTSYDVYTEAKSAVMREKFGINSTKDEEDPDDPDDGGGGGRGRASTKSRSKGKGRYSIVGEKGLRSNEKAMRNLSLAREMEKNGEDAKTIWLATGWEKGKDGKWRSEIPDVEMKDSSALKNNDSITLGELIDAPELFKSYPDLKYVIVDKNTRNGDEGSYDGAIHISPSTLELGDPFTRSVLTHEIQHAIQSREGWEGGVPSPNMTYFKQARETYEKAKDILKKDYTAVEARRFRKSETDGVKKSIYADIEIMLREGVSMDDIRKQYEKDYADLEKKQKQVTKDYLNAGGEVGARVAQYRLSMSEEERRNTPISESRFSTSRELDEREPGWNEGSVKSNGGDNTQVTNTTNTYKKIGEWLKKAGMKAASILDASSGKGLGTRALRAMGFKVDDVEPYPEKDREKPTFAKYEDIEGQYDVVISNAVLNVIPDDWRANVLHQMAAAVKPGGRMIINTRGAGEAKNVKNKKELDSPNEVMVLNPDGSYRHYQRFFTFQELKQWIESELGEGWRVERATTKNAGFGNEQACVVYREAEGEELFRDGDTFFSNAEKAVEGINQEKATPEQWLAMIQKAGGLKAEEDKWMGLSDWLNEQAKTKKSLTKQEVLDFIRANEVKVEEVEYGEGGNIEPLRAEYPDFDEAFEIDEYSLPDGSPTVTIKDNRKAVDIMNDIQAKKDPNAEKFELDENGEFVDPDDKSIIEDNILLEIVHSGPNPINSTRLSYTTRGLENNKEIAFVVPNVEPYKKDDSIHFGPETGGRAVVWVRFGETTNQPGNDYAAYNILNELKAKYGNATPENMTDEDAARREYANYLSRGEHADLDTSKALLTSRFGAERGERVFSLLKEMVENTQKEKRVLVIDEIQSKRHQEGRRNGYKSELAKSPKGGYLAAQKAMQDYRKAMQEKYGEFFVEDDLTEEERKQYKRLYRDMFFKSGYKDEKLYNVPDAPFQNNWHEFALKRMLRYAAEHGYDMVAWTTGEQQVERYNLKKVIDTIESTPTKNGHDVYIQFTNGKRVGMGINQEGKIESDDDTFNGKNASEVFGKDLALKITSSTEELRLEDLDLEIGGKGMRGFYDKMLVNFMDKYGKKWGVKTHDVTLPNVEPVGRTMHAVDVTPEMKESVMQGQPMFRPGETLEDDYEASLSSSLKAGYSKAQHDAMLERRMGRVRSAAEKIVEKLRLGERVTLLESTEGLSERKTKAKGWYDPKTGKIFIVLGNHRNGADVMQTLLHEGVAHYGLRELFGDSFNTFLDNVYKNATESVKGRIDALAKQKHLSKRTATEEYLATLAEDTDFERAQRSGWWAKILNEFVTMLRKLGLEDLIMPGDISDNELRYILWRSYENLTEPGRYKKPEVDATAVESRLTGESAALSTTSRENRDTQRAAELEAAELYRDGEGDARFSTGATINSTARQWDKIVNSLGFGMTEVGVDYLHALKRFQEFLEKQTGKAILYTQNVYDAMLQVSSRNFYETKKFDGTIGRALNSAILDLLGNKLLVKSWRKWLNTGKLDFEKNPELQALDRYVKLKHGVERNRDMSVRKVLIPRGRQAYQDAMDAALKPFRDNLERIEQEMANNDVILDMLKQELENLRRSKADKSAIQAKKDEIARAKDTNKRLREERKETRRQIKDRIKHPHNYGLLSLNESIEAELTKWYDLAAQVKEDARNAGKTWRETQEALDDAAISLGEVVLDDYSGLSDMTKSSNLFNQIAYDEVEEYESNKDADKLANLWTAIRGVTDFSLLKQQESGLVDNTYYDAQKRRFDYFVPLRGWAEMTAEDMYEYLNEINTELGNPVKAMYGRLSEAGNAFGSMFNVAYGSINSGNRNEALTKFYNLIQGHPTDIARISGGWLERIEDPDGGPDIWEYREVELNGNETEEEMIAKIDAFEAEMREKAENGDAMRDHQQGARVPYKITKPRTLSQHQVRIQINGQTRVITIGANPRVTEALNGLLNPSISDNMFVQGWKKVKNVKAGLLTSMSINFASGNIDRDTSFAMVNSYVRYGSDFAKAFARHQGAYFLVSGAGARIKWAQMGRLLYLYNNKKLDESNPLHKDFKDFMDYGGATGYTFLVSMEQSRKQMEQSLRKLNRGGLHPLSFFKAFSDFVELITQSSELTNRFSAYQAGKDLGWSRGKCISVAKEITANFNRKGAGDRGKREKDPVTWRKNLVNLTASGVDIGTAVNMFFNASIQGKYALWLALKANPMKGAAVAVGLPMLLGAIMPLVNDMFLPLIYAALGWDDYPPEDESYWDFSDYNRQNNIRIRLPKKVNILGLEMPKGWLKFSLSQELTPFFSVGDVIAGAMYGGRELQANDLLQPFVSLASPINVNLDNMKGVKGVVREGLGGTAFSEIADLVANRDFLGRKIYQEDRFGRDANRPNSQKGVKRTSPAMTDFAKTLNEMSGGNDVTAGWVDINPSVVEHLGNAFGGYFKLPMDFIDMAYAKYKGEEITGTAIENMAIFKRNYDSSAQDAVERRQNSRYWDVVKFGQKMEYEMNGYEKKYKESMQMKADSTDSFAAAELVKEQQKWAKLRKDFASSEDYQFYTTIRNEMKAIEKLEDLEDRTGVHNETIAERKRALVKKFKER